MTAPIRRNATLVLVTMTLANAMILVDQTAVPLALPNILQGFHVGTHFGQWVLNCSLLPLAGLLVFGGRLGDLIGLRRVFLIGLALFTTGSALGGLALDFDLLLVARVIQGVGGALILPTTIAIVSATYSPEQRGRALGAMGGSAAIAGAFGPTIGGLLTSVFDWRAVLLVNVPLGLLAFVLAVRNVPARATDPEAERQPIDVPGTVFLSLALVAIVFGLSQSQTLGWGSPEVAACLLVALLSGAAFVIRERFAPAPLVDFKLLRHRNYLGASLSQLLSGMAEIGLGVIFPLLLILNMEMTPAVAGLALIPTTLPMIVIAPLAGRWYDRTGGRAPLVTGFLLLGISGILLALAVGGDDIRDRSYLELLPGLLAYGVGLALILTVNDPVTLDTIPAAQQGEASGVSATAEQFGGALGIGVLYSVFHATYVDRLHSSVHNSPLPDINNSNGPELRSALEAAQNTGLRPEHFDPAVRQYLSYAGEASSHGYAVTFLVVSALAVIGAVATGWLVRTPDSQPE